MKLAEALLLRADLKKKLLSLRERIGRNAMVQEGEAPKEKVEDLLAEATSALQEQQALVRRINAANESAKLPDGRPASVPWKLHPFTQDAADLRLFLACLTVTHHLERNMTR